MTAARDIAVRRVQNYFHRAAVMAALFCFAWVVAMSTGVPAFADEPPTPTEVLWLETAEGQSHKISVEVARTMAEKSRGLMFRTSLGPDQGMLFPYSEAGNHAMWMRNTYIPLDMVFIKANGHVHRIEANTEPFSESVIAAGAPVTGVLELAGGVASKLGLKAGDLVRHSWFGTAKTDK